MEIIKDDYKCKHEFSQKRAQDSFIHEYLTPHHIQIQTARLIASLKFSNLAAAVKTSSASCKLVLVR